MASRIRRKAHDAPQSFDEAKVQEWIRQAEERLLNKVRALLANSDRFNMDTVDRMLSVDDDLDPITSMVSAEAASLRSELGIQRNPDTGPLFHYNPFLYLTDMFNTAALSRRQFRAFVGDATVMHERLRANSRQSADWNYAPDLRASSYLLPEWQPVRMSYTVDRYRHATLNIDNDLVWTSLQTVSLSTITIAVEERGVIVFYSDVSDRPYPINAGCTLTVPSWTVLSATS